MSDKMVYCYFCQKKHRYMSRPYIRCFGIPADMCNLYEEGDKIAFVVGHRNGYGWPVKVGQTLKEFVDDYQDFFNMGITVRSEI